MFKGSLVALITPMRADGSVDEKAYAEFVDWQIKEGTDAVVPVGTTGESPTLSHAEHRRVVEIAIEVAKGRVPVIAGAGSNSTAEAIDLARHAKQAAQSVLMNAGHSHQNAWVLHVMIRYVVNIRVSRDQLRPLVEPDLDDQRIRLG